MSISIALVLAASTLSATSCPAQIPLLDERGHASATIILAPRAAGIQWPHTDGTILLEGATGDVREGQFFAPLTSTLVLTYDRRRCADGAGWSGEPSTGVTATYYCRALTGDSKGIARHFPDGAFEIYGKEPDSEKPQDYSLIFDDQDRFLGISFRKKASRINGKRPKAWKVGKEGVSATWISKALSGECGGTGSLKAGADGRR